MQQTTTECINNDSKVGEIYHLSDCHCLFFWWNEKVKANLMARLSIEVLCSEARRVTCSINVVGLKLWMLTG